MKITASTTDEQITAQIDNAKQALARAVADRTLDGESMLRKAQYVVNAEALARAQYTYRNVLRNNPERRVEYLFDLLARGADDAWSGRGNDSRRAAADEVRKWADQQFGEIRFEGSN